MNTEPEFHTLSPALKQQKENDRNQNMAMVVVAVVVMLLCVACMVNTWKIQKLQETIQQLVK
jgi:cell division protein FtsX